MRTSLSTLAGVVLLTAASFGLAEGPAPAPAPAAKPAPAAAPATQPSGLAEALRAISLRPVDAEVAWSQGDAQQKVLQHINSRQAHRKAVVALQQCQECHAGDGDPVLLDPHGYHASTFTQGGPWIGVSVGPADDVLRSQLKLPEGTGVVVTKVVPEGPAHAADVQEHDILLSVNGQPVPDGDALDAIVKATKADGPPLTLKLLREGKAAEKQVTPSQQTPSTVQFLSTFIGAQPRRPYRIGLSVSAPDETLRKQLGLEAGVVVTAVEDGSPAAKQGVKVNDLLLSANGKALKDPEALPDVVQQAAETQIGLELLRGGVRLKIGVTPVKDPAAEAVNYLAFDVSKTAADELMVLQPGRDMTVISNWLNAVQPPALQPATTQPQSAQTPAERLNQLTAQLDQLRATVELLRADLEKQNQK